MMNIRSALYVRLSIKITALFLLMVVVPAAIFSFVGFNNIKDHLTKQVLHQLLLLAETKEGQVYIYLEALQVRAGSFVSDGFIADHLARINAGGEDAAALATELSGYLLRRKMPVDDSITGISIFNKQGKIVSSTRADSAIFFSKHKENFGSIPAGGGVTKEYLYLPS